VADPSRERFFFRFLEVLMKHSTLPVFLLSMLPLAGRADDWPQWRGPNRTDV
jgi:hypothetical protein